MVAISSPRGKDSDGASHSLRLPMPTETTTLALPLSLLCVSLCMFCPNLKLQDHRVVLFLHRSEILKNDRKAKVDF